MSENDEPRSDSFDTEGGLFPRPLTPPTSQAENRPDIHEAVRIGAGIGVLLGLAMFVYGLANVELENLPSGFLIPLYGFATIVYALCSFHLLRHITGS